MYEGLQNVAQEQRTKSGPIEFANIDATKESIAVFVQNELGIEHLDETADFFAIGMDSLVLLNLLRAINVSRSTTRIEAKFIYDHPSIRKLAMALHNSEAFSGYEYANDSDDEQLQDAWLAMDRIYKESVNAIGKEKRRGIRDLGRSKDDGPVIPPDGGVTAWQQVLAMFLINVNNWGLVNSFGVFQAYYESDLLAHRSSSAISWIGTLQGALLLIVGVVAGPLFDKGFFKVTLVVGSMGLVFATMMLSICTEYYQILLSQGILLGICQGLLYIPSVALIPVYFKHRRGIALGITTGGGPIGGVLFPAIFSGAISTLGFGWTVRIIGFISLVTLSIAMALSKPIGQRATRQLIDESAFTLHTLFSWHPHFYCSSECVYHIFWLRSTAYKY